jgi:hypothetical protein
MSLESPLEYSVEVTDEGDGIAEIGGQALSLSKQRALAALAALAATSKEQPQTAQQVAASCDTDGRGPSYGLRTWQKVLAELADVGLADGEDDGPGTTRRWWILAG